MNNQVLVSIIIPTFNEQKTIKDCLETLLSQEFDRNEIIVVDDGSTDSTREIVQNFPVRFLAQPHLGPAKARNLGAKEAKGKVLVFVDADMTFEKCFIKDLTAPVIEDKFQGTFSKEEYVGNWENIWARCWNINQNWPYKRMIPEDFSDQGTDFRAVLKSEFLRVGGFDDTGYTDTWTLKDKLGYSPQAVRGAKYYHYNPDNLLEIFNQAKWVSKRSYKFGFLGLITALARTSLPISIMMGLYKSIKFHTPQFSVFKVVYDFGYLLGILEMLVKGKLSK